jgi:hypothetical protein
MEQVSVNVADIKDQQLLDYDVNDDNKTELIHDVIDASDRLITSEKRQEQSVVGSVCVSNNFVW